MRYVVLEGRVQRKDRRELVERLLRESPLCRNCLLDMVEMQSRKLLLYGVFVSLWNFHKKVPLHPSEPTHPVNVAVRGLGFTRYRWNDPPWDLDHIVPLWAGGDQSDANYQLLCQPCHAEKTREEAGQRKRFRAKPWLSGHSLKTRRTP